MAKKATINNKKRNSKEASERVTRVKAVDDTRKKSVKPTKVKQVTADEVATVSEESAPAGKKETVVLEPINKKHRGTKAPLTKRIMEPRILAMIIAEFLGTMILTAVVLASQAQSIIMMFALIAIVLTVGAVSGAYVNPALTIAGWATKRISGLRAVAFIIAQVMGAVVALSVLSMFVASAPAPEANSMLGGAGQVQLFHANAIPQNKQWLVLAAEMLGMFVFALGVARATRERNPGIAALSVGGGLFLGALIGGAAAAAIGGSAILNPAVAVAANAFKDISTIWPIAVYVIATSIAAVLGFVVYDILNRASNITEEDIVTARD